MRMSATLISRSRANGCERMCTGVWLSKTSFKMLSILLFYYGILPVCFALRPFIVLVYSIWNACGGGEEAALTKFRSIIAFMLHDTCLMCSVGRKTIQTLWGKRLLQLITECEICYSASASVSVCMHGVYMEDGRHGNNTRAQHHSRLKWRIRLMWRKVVCVRESSTSSLLSWWTECV